MKLPPYQPPNTRYRPPTPPVVFFRSCAITVLLGLLTYAAGLAGLAVLRGWRPW